MSGQLLQQMVVEKSEMSRVGSNGSTSNVMGVGVLACVSAADASAAAPSSPTGVGATWVLHPTARSTTSTGMGFNMLSDHRIPGISWLVGSYGDYQFRFSVLAVRTMGRRTCSSTWQSRGSGTLLAFPTELSLFPDVLLFQPGLRSQYLEILLPLLPKAALGQNVPTVFDSSLSELMAWKPDVANRSTGTEVIP